MIVFHRRIENFLNDMGKAVNLVDKQNVMLMKIGENRRQIAGAFNNGTGGNFYIHPKLARHDISQCRFSETRRPIEKYVVQSLVSHFSRLDKDGKIVLYLFLADIFGKAP